MRFSVVQILGKNVRMEQDPDLDFDLRVPKTFGANGAGSGPGLGPRTKSTTLLSTYCGTVAKEFFYSVWSNSLSIQYICMKVLLQLCKVIFLLDYAYVYF